MFTQGKEFGMKATDNLAEAWQEVKTTTMNLVCWGFSSQKRKFTRRFGLHTRLDLMKQMKKM